MTLPATWEEAAAIFDEFNGLCREFCKEDIAAVQARIAIVLPLVRENWNAVIEDALEDLIAQLRELEEGGPSEDVAVIETTKPERRDKVLQDFVVALIASLFVKIKRGFNAIDALVIRTMQRQLLEEGARTTGAKLLFDSARTQRLLQLGVQDLEFWLGHVGTVRQNAIKTMLRTFLTTREVRVDPAAFRAWVAQFRQIFSDIQGPASDFLVDLWAYRGYAIGQLRGAELAGIQTLRAKAVRDHKTTPFCLWVDGQIIDVALAEKQIVDYYAAIDDGDAEAAKKAWPLLTGSDAKQTPAFFNDLFGAKEEGRPAQIGLPPYHGRCRTTVVSG